MATYYISNTGNDSNNGTSTGTPWQTITKVNEQSFAPGDIIAFNKGDEWNGVRLRVLGSNITITSYGTGDKPIISGWKILTGWVSEGGGIYSVVDASELDTMSIALIDGAIQNKGRLPKTGWWRIDARTGTADGTITSDDLQGQPNFIGAEIVINKNSWIVDRGNVTDHQFNTLTYTGTSATSASVGRGFFIQNNINCLSEFGEWFFDGVSKKFYMYFGAENPDTYEIKVSALQDVIDIPWNRTNQTYDDITVQGGNRANFYHMSFEGNESFNHSILNSIIELSGGDGIGFDRGGTGTTVSNCVVRNCKRRGVNFGDNYDVTFTDNLIENIGLDSGQLGNGSDSSGSGLVFSTGNYNSGGHTVQRNKIFDVGYLGIRGNGSNLLIEHNVIRKYNLRKVDGGGIYLHGRGEGGVPGDIHINRIVRKNIISNPDYIMPFLNMTTNEEGFGIYFDEQSRNIICEDNIVMDNYIGIYLHCAGDIDIKRNIVYNSRVRAFVFNHSLSATSEISYITGLDVQDNIIFGVGNSGALSVTNLTTGDPDGFGVINNNLYVFPDRADIFRSRSMGGSGINRDFADWQTLGWYDSTSTLSPVTNNISTLEYNDTESNITITPDVGTTDVYGDEFIGDVTLLPFEGVIIVGEGTPPEPEPEPEPENEIIFPSNPTLYHRYPEQGEIYTPHYIHIGNNVWDFVPNIGNKKIQFYPTEQIDDFTITADMLYKLVEINSATDVEVTVDNMGEGDWIPFDTLGAGLPIFFLGATELFTDEDFTGATSFILIRLENDGVTERYGVKYG